MVARDPDKKCPTCMYSDQVSENGPRHCRFNPPVADLSSEMNNWAVFPEVSPDDWCSRWMESNDVMPQTQTMEETYRQDVNRVFDEYHLNKDRSDLG